MTIIHAVDEMQQTADRLRGEGRRIGFVPTMGYLHEGHLDLLRLAAGSCDVVVLSIFVNPTQVAPHEDLDRYPRNHERDCALAEREGCNIVFIPDAADIYPADDSTWVQVERLGEALEGRTRPTHFRGVTTVVAKLFHIVRPHLAVFGQKDAQQAAIIRRMTRDLHFGIEIVIAPIRREADGLAMSSRNTYLSDQERVQALALSRSLRHAETLYRQGERDAATLRTTVVDELNRSEGIDLDYVELVDPDSFRRMEGAVGTAALIAVAARVGSTRLIDNCILGEKATQS